MKLFGLILAFLSLSIANGAHAQMPKNRCGRSDVRTIAYEHPYYSGATLALNGNGAIGDLREKDRHWWGSWNDAISSLEVPDGYQVILYRDKFYTGSSVTVDGHVSNLFNLRGVDWDDQASSLRVVSISACTARPKAIFYDQPYFRGRSFEVYPGESRERLRDKRRGNWGNWNDRIESIQIIGDFDVYLFEDTHYSGQQLWLSKSVEDLGDIGEGWDDRTSSFDTSY